MTPLDFARNLARSAEFSQRVLAVAIVARGLSDDDPATLRQGWPLAVAIPAAIEYLGLDSSAALVRRATIMAPSVSDAMLNRQPA